MIIFFVTVVCAFDNFGYIPVFDTLILLGRGYFGVS